MNCAKTRLRQLTGLPFAECKDMISRHCETCGCAIIEAVIAVIQNRNTPVLDVAYDALTNVLEKASSEELVDILFEPDQRATQSNTLHQFTMWSPSLKKATKLVQDIMNNNITVKSPTKTNDKHIPCPYDHLLFTAAERVVQIGYPIKISEQTAMEK